MHQQEQAGQHRGRQQDLGRAQAEDQAPHGFQTLEGQFEPDREQQEDDAELGQAVRRMGTRHGKGRRLRPLMGDLAHDVGPEQHADQQEAQDRRNLQALEHRHDHRRGQQEDDDKDVVVARPRPLRQGGQGRRRQSVGN